ncbi:MAG: cyclic pyranopterin monophosphate synthase MoaC [Gammaproteobacteria bacterium]|jgi:cyclic pyranopterin phosphate synthase|nr:cyclic pyranopterin monophosphate synthase MoaC [Gammaproteobacteria bacterium]
MAQSDNPLTHLDAQGNARMVDVGDKPSTHRVAVAQGRITMAASTAQLISAGGHKKGDVIAIARIAGIQGAKQTSQLIPLCHPLMLTSVSLDLEVESDSVLVTARCKVNGHTGIEMEALTAVSVACLTIYDMCKAVDKDMQIGEIRLLEKLGGRSGHYLRQEAEG